MSAGEWVFGYASLMTDCPRADAVAARLPGYRRVWGVAADNTRTVPGYKIYLDRADGSRPPVFVAFLDLKPDDEAVVNGLASPVDGADLVELDLRERNYDRVEVTGAVDGVAGRVWAYMGSAEGRARLREGVDRGSAVVSRDYVDKVHAGLTSLSDADRLPEGPPVRDLDSVDLAA